MVNPCLADASWLEEETPVGDDEVTAYGLGGFAKYHFMRTNQWVTSVDARLVWSFAETDEAVGHDDEFDGVRYGPVAGLRFELSDNNDFFAEYRHTLFGGDFDKLYDDSHGVFVGIIHQSK